MSSHLVEATWLAVIQGLTEFLPISRGGHLALASILFELKRPDPALAFTLGAGSCAAAVLVLRARVFDAVGQGLRGLVNPSRLRKTTGGRDALAALVAGLPTAAIALGLGDFVERWAASPALLGIGFLLTTIALLSTRWVPAGTLESPGIAACLLIGVAQGLAALPGLSRCGLSVCLALWLGVRSERAFELSILMSLPAVAGAALLNATRIAGMPLEWGRGLLGALVALAVASFALFVFRRAVVASRLPLFALWTFPLGLATLAMARAWPG